MGGRDDPHKPNANLGMSDRSSVSHRDQSLLVFRPDFQVLVFDRRRKGTLFVRRIPSRRAPPAYLLGGEFPRLPTRSFTLTHGKNISRDFSQAYLTRVDDVLILFSWRESAVGTGQANVNQLFGALLVSATALAIAALLISLQLQKIQLFTNFVGIWFLLCAGAAAFSIDYFTLQAYSKGLPISVGAPIGIAGGIATAVVIGLLLGEQVSLAKLTGIVLVVLGGIVLE